MLSIATRYFGTDAQSDLPRLSRFIEHALSYGIVQVAIDPARDCTHAMEYVSSRYPTVHLLAVQPWQQFAPALNALIFDAARYGAEHILFASVEFPVSLPILHALQAQCDTQTQVVGARFAGHRFAPGWNLCTGLTVPWNTCAMWNMQYLARVGVPLGVDAPFDVKQSGVEEVATVSLIARLYGAQAKLVHVPGFGEQWNTDGWTPERLELHYRKMASKLERPASQLKWMQLQSPMIEHVIG